MLFICHVLDVFGDAKNKEPVYCLEATKSCDTKLALRIVL